jgi:hypothetical protein
MDPWSPIERMFAEQMRSLHEARELRLPDNRVYVWICDIPFLHLLWCDRLCLTLSATRVLPRLLCDVDLRAEASDPVSDGVQETHARQLFYRLEFALDVLQSDSTLRYLARREVTLETGCRILLIRQWHESADDWAKAKYGYDLTYPES